MKEYFIYTGIIDCFAGWQTATQYAKTLLENKSEDICQRFNLSFDNCPDFMEYIKNIKAVSFFYQYLKVALNLLKEKTNWDGEIRFNEVLITGYPNWDYGETCILVCVKQDNNGDTFIYSPIKLTSHPDMVLIPK